jgi:hypothetical protein
MHAAPPRGYSRQRPANVFEGTLTLTLPEALASPLVDPAAMITVNASLSLAARSALSRALDTGEAEKGLQQEMSSPPASGHVDTVFVPAGERPSRYPIG